MTLNALVHFVIFAGSILISPEVFHAAEAAPSAVSAEEAAVYEVKGVLKEVRDSGKKALIAHEAIPDYMEAMTMEFPVKDPREMSSLNAGDSIAFRLSVTETDGWIERVRKIGVAPSTPIAMPSSSASVTKAAPELKPGDPLPEYSLLNQNGEAVQLRQFKGRAVAISFIFTRCPFPNFCPLMNNNFKRIQNELLKSAPENGWHLLSVSIDPDHDTPQRLTSYAKQYNPDPAVWSFLTGEDPEIRRLAASFGIVTSGAGASLNHNLRTVVVDADGRVHRIFIGNEWTHEELVGELKKVMETP